MAGFAAGEVVACGVAVGAIAGAGVVAAPEAGGMPAPHDEQ